MLAHVALFNRIVAVIQLKECLHRIAQISQPSNRECLVPIVKPSCHRPAADMKADMRCVLCSQADAPFPKLKKTADMQLAS